MRLTACRCGGAQLKDSVDKIADVVNQLGTWEREALLLIARRLLQGQLTYGCFAPATDRRNFEQESADELADDCVYRAFNTIVRRLP
jgi:hypothetical protein